ncbi:MAG: hypothetical protein DDT19_01137 [Syntrophomonadaceae bacterium]|nr:hypothetical protein [Bacillota bacterium]
MQKTIREVDSKRGIVQVTIADERHYLKPSKDEATGLPVYIGVPSVTWIASYYYKSPYLTKWIAEQGWSEAEAIKKAAGDKGSRVHLAIEQILAGEEFRIDTKVLDKTSGEMVELSLEELICVKSFCDWRDSVKPEILATEITIFSDKHGYAGTIDLICRIDGVLYVVDFKTSKQVWMEHELQISAYRAALESGENPIYERNENGTDTSKMISPTDMKTAILQVGYNRNKNGYKFTETIDRFDMFLTAKKIWALETDGQDIKVLEFPIVLSEGKKKMIVPEAEAQVAELAEKKRVGRPKKTTN